MTATAPAPTKAKRPQELHPDDYRMSIGEHLEELRARLILGLIGFIIAFAICLIFGEDVIALFCKPLVESMLKAGLNPQVYYTEVADGFMVYMQISMISAAVLASPWMLYQLWKFIAAGLYPHERKYVTKYLPLSIVLLLSGMLFLYFYVLPVSIEFFLKFSGSIPLKMPAAVVAPAVQEQARAAATQPAFTIPTLMGDPPSPVEHQMWIDALQNRLKIFMGGAVRVINFGGEHLAAPMITLPRYIDMVVGMLLAFGISFQMPLVVLALVRVGIVDVVTLRSIRKYVYFAMSIVAAVIIPDVVTGMIALMVPLMLLYELGIFLAARGGKKAEA